jgi:hypothetical protein
MNEDALNGNERLFIPNWSPQFNWQATMIGIYTFFVQMA